MKQLVLAMVGNILPTKIFFFNFGWHIKWFYTLVFALVCISAGYTQSASEVQLEREWVKLYPNADNNYAATVATEISPDNSVVVLGFNRNASSESKLVLTKLSLAGEVVWQREFEGFSGSIGESPQQMEIDHAGNIYIFGSVELAPDSYDYMALKYNGAGELVWAHHVDGGGNTRDLPADMSITENGAMYVTGSSQMIGNIRTMTVRIDEEGNLDWVKMFDGPTDDSDPRGQSIAVDVTGNPIISGNHFIFGEGRKLFVLKYNGQAGHEEWKSFLESTAQGGSNSADEMLLDAAGNIYLVGTRGPGDLSNSRPLLVKLNSQGSELWSKADESPSYNTFITDAALDEHNNLVLLASSQFGRQDTEVYLAKYDPEGLKIWGELLQSTPGNIYYPRALALQTGGNIAFTGMVRGSLPHEVGDLFTYLYSESGTRLGFDRYNNTLDVAETGSDLVFDTSGNLYVAGHAADKTTSATELLVLKYNAGDTATPPVYAQYHREWVSPFGETFPPRFMEVDGEGNPIAVGNNKVARYDANGNLLWSGNYIGTELRIAIDGQNAVYILSHFTGANPENIVTKYTSEGARAWEYRYKPTGILFYVSDFDVNKAGEVFLTGTVTGSEEKSYVQTMKVNASGTELVWLKEYNGYREMKPSAFGLRVNEQGDVLVVGQDVVLTEHTNLYEEKKPFLLKYRGADGSMLLEREYSQQFTAYNPQLYTLHNMGLDKSGNVYVVGQSQNQIYPGFAAFVFKLSAEGAFEWKKDVSERRLELFRSSIDENGNAVLLAAYQALEGPRLELVTRINSEGEQSWSKSFYSGEGLAEVGNSTVGNVLAMPNGLTAIGGSITSGPDDFSMELSFMLISEEGEIIYKDAYANQATADHGVRSMAADAEGNVYAGGYSLETSPVSVMLLVKYSPVSEEEPCNVPVDVKLYLPPVAKRVGWQVRTTADFGSYILNEDTGVRWTWGDGSEPTISYTAFGTPRITGEHTYQEAGIYTIGLDFEQSCLRPASADYTQQMVIYDPEAGFVTGNGEMAAPEIAGKKKLTYTFSVRYPNQYSQQPVGNLRVMLGDMGNMVSKTFDWLVISGDRAAMQGTATITGKGTYKFVATVTDAGAPGADDPGDGMRIQVWDMNEYGKLVFDNYPAGAQKLDLQQPLPSVIKGQIVINGRHAGMAAKGKSKLEASAAEHATAYPNPFSDRATVRFNSNKGGAYEIELYDAKGALVSVLKSGTATADEAIVVEVKGNDLKDGLYFVKLMSGNSVQSVKLLLQR